MNFLLPFLDGTSLNQLCLVNSEWCETVRDFIRDFNKVIRMTVNHRDNIFHFITREATKVKLIFRKYFLNKMNICPSLL